MPPAGSPGRPLSGARRSHLRRTALAAVVLSLAVFSDTATAKVTPPTPPAGTVVVPAASRGAFPGEVLVYPANCADPSVATDPAGGYLMVCTGGGLPAIKLLHSTDLLHWSVVKEALFTKENHPQWTKGPFWGPTLVEVDGGWRLYYSALNRDGHFEIGVATAASPTGPFVDSGRPILGDGREGDIDPSVFHDSDGTTYLLWKVNGNAEHKPSQIWIQPLARNGLAVTGKPHMLIQSDMKWEGGVVEGPTMLQHDGRYYLFYGTNAFNSPRYAIGVAQARTLLGPWEQRSRPLLASSGKWSGPGGTTVITTRKGQTVMLWNAFYGHHYEGIRNVMAGGLTWPKGSRWPALAERPAPHATRASATASAPSQAATL